MPSVFDAIGLLAVVAFGLTLWLARVELSRPTGEVPLRVDAEALAAGFREGVSWHGLYRDGEHVGFSRVERRREGDGFRTAQTLVLPAPGQSGPDAARQSVAIVSRLDAQFVLRSFTVEVTGGPKLLRHVKVRAAPSGIEPSTADHPTAGRAPFHAPVVLCFPPRRRMRSRFLPARLTM